MRTKYVAHDGPVSCEHVHRSYDAALRCAMYHWGAKIRRMAQRDVETTGLPYAVELQNTAADFVRSWTD